MSKVSVPKYRRQKRRGVDLAFVELSGRRVYLGQHGTQESLEEYHRQVAEWLANGRQLTVEASDITVNELLARYWTFAQSYFRRPDGTVSSELGDIKRALKPLRELYGSTRACEFGARALKTVRQKFIDRGNSRSYINRNVNYLRRVFKWGAGEELVPPTVYQGLAAVANLKRGEGDVPDRKHVTPVDIKHVEAVKPHVARQVWAIIQLQLVSGARSGELVTMRPRDLETSGGIWTYTPANHKTDYRGHSRTVYLGPRGQEILKPFLEGRDPDSFVFSSREAVAESRQRRRADRRTPLSCGNRPGTNVKSEPKCEPGGRYTVESYARAITRACKEAEIPHWHPHQLRHNAATELRKEFGVDVARIILGHRSPAVTEIYAELDHGKAVSAMEEFG